MADFTVHFIRECAKDGRFHVESSLVTDADDADDARKCALDGNMKPGDVLHDCVVTPCSVH